MKKYLPEPVLRIPKGKKIQVEGEKAFVAQKDLLVFHTDELQGWALEVTSTLQTCVENLSGGEPEDVIDNAVQGCLEAQGGFDALGGKKPH